MHTDADTPRRFAVALSFPGEHRVFVEAVAGHLAAQFSKDRVLYDKYHDAEFARLDLNTYLPTLYRKDSELIVIFLCPEYAAKQWCRLEWRHVSQLIATVDAKRVMLLSFGNPGDLSELGILSGDAYIDILQLTSQVVAEKIIKRLRLNEGITPPRTPPDSALTLTSEFDISRIIKYAPAELIGREAETKLLSDAWDQAIFGEPRRPRVIAFVALGGEGKTSLVAKWVAELAHQDWPGCDAAFAWTFYSQGTRDQAAASSDVFLKEALTFFGDAALAGSAQGAFGKGRRLAQLVGERRALLILDGLEPLQYAPTSPTPGELKDQGLAALLKGLAAVNHGLCVVTTRYSILDLRGYWRTTAPEVKLTRLSKEAGVALLRRLGVMGNQKELETLVEDVQGHALTLNLLGAYLHDAHAGDIRKRDLVKLAEADAEEQGGHAFRVMDAYVLSFESAGEKGKRALALLRLLGLFDRPATADCLEALWTGDAIPGLTEPLIGISEPQRNMALTRLESAKLLTVNRDAVGTLLALDAHPLLREYFAKRIREQHPNAWKEGHKRLYLHLSGSVPYRPEGLDGLQPLYQAVAHGCQAGFYDDALKVYRERILRGDAFYSTGKLGAISADLAMLACFFDVPWSRVTTAISDDRRAWLLNDTGWHLLALGRLVEAREPLKSALDLHERNKNWIFATGVAFNMSDLEQTLGDLDAAERHARRAVELADRSGDTRQKLEYRAALADVLHQKGQRGKASEYFSNAEAMEATKYPESPLLHSRQGFWFCDLLLAESERASWQQVQKIAVKGQRSEWENTCRQVEQRAKETLLVDIRDRAGLVILALPHLTLGRVALYQAVLESGEPERTTTLEAARRLITAAVDGLRAAGTIHELPRGLLTRAWLRSLTGPCTGHASAQSDLDEAWEIAERGAMKLHMADIHLHRARLFFREAHYPWDKHPDGTPRGPKDDLIAAEKLIDECGYHRRDEELADAEEAIKLGGNSAR